jgi:hypothetical protein
MSQKVETATVNVPAHESAGRLLPRDAAVWDRLNALIEDNGHTAQHLLETWPSYVRRIHMSRFIAHYELFRQIIDLPGSIIEFGVYRGASFFTWAKLLEIFCPGDRRRHVFGFESFKGLGKFHEKDGIARPDLAKQEGAWSAEKVEAEVVELVNIVNQDNFVVGNKRCQIIAGLLEDTLDKFIHENPGVRFSLAHFDVDLYAPTKYALERVYDLVVPGGLLVFDEYGFIPWEGETKAVDEFLAERGIKTVLRKFPYSTQPHGYFVKE